MPNELTHEEAHAIAKEVYARVNGNGLISVPAQFHTPVFAMRGLPTNENMRDLAMAVANAFAFEPKLLRIYEDLKRQGKL